MEVVKTSTYQCVIRCHGCGYVGSRDDYPAEITDPFENDSAIEGLSEYQCQRLVHRWDRDSFGARYRSGQWSRCDFRDTIRAWHDEGLAGSDRSLIMSGAMGTGKTVAMGLMMTCLAARNEFSFCAWNMSALLSFLHNWRDWGNDHDDDSTMVALRRSKYLFVDDIGVEYNSPLAMSRFNELIEHRYSRELLHVATSNLSEVDLAQREGWIRIVDRLQENVFDWCEIGGRSKRRPE
jgi:predicted ATPase